MVHPKFLRYSRKQYTATLHLIAVDGVACEVKDKERVALINADIFKKWTKLPECL